jgi:hypothetical protein
VSHEDTRNHNTCKDAAAWRIATSSQTTCNLLTSLFSSVLVRHDLFIHTKLYHDCYISNAMVVDLWLDLMQQNTCIHKNCIHRGNPEVNSYQQNSNLQGGVQVICMQPWFFSIGRLHLGQGFEFAKILSQDKDNIILTRLITSTVYETYTSTKPSWQLWRL